MCPIETTRTFQQVSDLGAFIFDSVLCYPTNTTKHMKVLRWKQNIYLSHFFSLGMASKSTVCQVPCYSRSEETHINVCNCSCNPFPWKEASSTLYKDQWLSMRHGCQQTSLITSLHLALLWVWLGWVLCFAFVDKSVWITQQCFGYWSALTQHQGFTLAGLKAPDLTSPTFLLFILTHFLLSVKFNSKHHCFVFAYMQNAHYLSILNFQLN